MPDVIKVNPGKPEKAIISKAAKIICEGGLVAFPTETVYGIAGLAKNRRKLDLIKKRPHGKPYTVHIAHKKDLYKFVSRLSPQAKEIIRCYWPGPLTLILKNKFGKKVGFRMPDNKIALSLIRAVGEPILAPSANVSGEPSPFRAKDVCRGTDLVLDGGTTKYKKDSTIVDLTCEPPKILRKGCLRLRIPRPPLKAGSTPFTKGVRIPRPR